MSALPLGFESVKYVPNVNWYVAHWTVGLHEPQLRSKTDHRHWLDVGHIDTVDPWARVRFFFWVWRLTLINKAKLCGSS